MNNLLDKYRHEINQIDQQIVQLFEKRMDVVGEICQFKQDHHLKITDRKREQELFNKNLSYLQKNEYASYYQIVFKSFLKASKKMQKHLIKK